ncbi:BCCT family transporter [Arthrobacter sp. AL08]|uniref:BCCT family transporter n=1 Tax=Micrococcaceae TaxID=1268 RepID=UPI001D001721|nr:MULTISPECIES: BCCT family transporter [Micrococcaceae]MCB5281908.1 Glycine betaine transporter OpuD [Arthrobacter sp. ES1]MDI3242350.1 BCCT family transporter [Arthrobacter sp. AL05]MDI3278360.1 BCCT family transporter [Arthrobacter sp. AL08]MDJ0351496.1 BCCT family transporter [Pseudarthrobacter sp. PH31-O2]WGZ78141.1 BCCT family transporter [Arthrobacter sp. EM1]
MAENTRPRIVERWVFWPAAVLVTVFAAFALLAPKTAEAMFSTIQSNIVNSFNWYYVLITSFFVAFSLFLGFSRFGDIKLGHDDDEPEFSLLAWFALLFAAGMGIGLVFYGVSEPLSHFANPRPGVSGTPSELAQQALSQTYLHWGVHAWSIYVVIGLALAYAIHRRKRPVSIRWALEPLLGKRVQGSWGNAIDVVALVGTLFGVATSLGLGVLQISAGLESINLVEASRGSEIVIIIIISFFVLLSVLSGLTKGMKWLSSINLVLAGLLVVYLLVFGPSTFLLREFVQSMGAYVQNFVSLSFNVNAFTGAAGEAWQASWTSFYWGWWISWAPFVGIFIARISKGRTVRQFVAGVILVPTLIGILWFSVLGGTALAVELGGNGTLLESDGSVNVSSALFSMLDFIPGTPVLTVGVILLIAIFFITSSDSGALVMGMIATGGQVNPKKRIRTFFVLITAVLAISLLISGGLVALQTAAIIIALPFSVVMLLICWSTFIAFSRERRAYDRARRAQLVDHIGDFYGLEVEELAENGILGNTPRWMQLLRRRGAPAGTAVPAEILPSPEPSTAAVDTLMAEAPQPRHASERALAIENAESHDVLISDVDNVVEHDPFVSRDAKDIPDRGDQEPSRW